MAGNAKGVKIGYQPTKADGEIAQCIKDRKSFVLDAGAGSGKTTSLIEALRKVLEDLGQSLRQQSQNIACITFTNVAKDEIIERTHHNPLVRVSTIHDFLWDGIKQYQRALKKALIVHNANLPAESRRKRDPAELEKALETTNVKYSDTGAEFLEGRIFHDDLLQLAAGIFAESTFLSKIIASRYPIIFVDEYQDTSPAVINILIDHILKEAANAVVIGFFGDKMQSIYSGGENPGVGEIPAAQQAHLVSIKKDENYRCSKEVINVLNMLRTDIKQYPAKDNADGAVAYFHFAANAADPIAAVRKHVAEKLGWTISAGTQKELFLTHALIAKKGGYAALLRAFNDRGGFYRDRLLKGDDKRIVFFRETVEPTLVSWEEGNTGKVLRILRDAGFALKDNASKAVAKTALDDLKAKAAAGTVLDVLAHLKSTGIISLPEAIQDLLAIPVQPQAGEAAEDEGAAERKFARALFGIPYSEITAFCTFLDEHTPFSTKHGVKGTEYDHVVVVLDDRGARWNMYSFDKYLSEEDATGNPERYSRTRNLFYVCCSRSKINLAVIDLGARGQAKDARVKTLFGANCFYL